MSLEFSQIRPRTTELASLERYYHFFSVAIYLIHFKFVGIEDMHMHNILEEFEIQPDSTTYYGVVCP